MKYIVLLCDGMADEKIDSLGNKTIMEAAKLDNFDYIASNGTCGLIHTTPEGMSPGSDICNLSIFGYNPKDYYTGRSPLEAASIGIELNENDFAFRCNLVTIENNTMEDFSGHHIDNETAKKIISHLSEKFKSENIEFYSGVGYRNLMIIRNADFNLKTTPPHDISGQDISKYLPAGDGSEKIREIMNKASEYLKEIDSKKVNAIWLWGEGKRPALDKFENKFGIKGAVIAAVDLIKGIGINAGLDIIEVPGATGFIDTDFKAKAEYAVKALDKYDYIFIHIEAPDEAGHMGSIEEKIKASENINNLVLPVLLDYIKQNDDVRILVTPDHPTPISIKTHTPNPVPAILYGKGISADENKEYNEFIKPTFNLKEGYKIAELLIK
jgi:2,3-bisphosphoglycerate-independent phosphoglycerate mutase